MLRVLFTMLALSFCLSTFAEDNINNAVYDNTQIVYNTINASWNIAPQGSDNEIIVTKKLIEGTGSYSIYNYTDGTIAFALPTGNEFIKNGNLVVIDNDLLKYSKIIYCEDNRFVQVEMSESEIAEAFPEAEIFRISSLESDNKIWLHKKLGKSRTLLLYNDTDRYFHRITCKSKNAQDNEIKGLVTFSRYGIYRFEHFGEYKGQITFYIR